MRNHAALSETILTRVPVFHEMACIGGGHHERLDGKGYPRGLRDDEIAPETRIVSVADVFDALTANRPYRGPCPWRRRWGSCERISIRRSIRSVSPRWNVRSSQSREISPSRLGGLTAKLRLATCNRCGSSGYDSTDLRRDTSR